jgi:putative membrane-bound dehydrogenase-like protein
MHGRTSKSLGAAAALIFAVSGAVAAPPTVNDDRYRLELVAAEPDIVTPIGMAFDGQGRLLVVESHTHQAPPEYRGPKHDRVRLLVDSDGDGRLDRWSTFAEGFRHAMNVLVRDDGAIYVVERGRLLLLRDTDDDGIADKQEVLLRLETEDDYPHNALGGIDLTPNGELIIGLGENHGLPFRLVGADGRVIAGTGGLDGFFRCDADGANLEHIARGVWNPFSLCVLGDGRVFAVDNDPDSSPPCRLLHVVDGGDYGYLYQYGRAGTHPLQCWNGELPGTLPMVCGTGEAPTAIVAHAGSLWVTSWGDHRIERYQLRPRGASYGAEREVVVQGDADFRPTGMAVAPDGSLYFGDWVLRDYPVHGRGRIWRLSLASGEPGQLFPPASSDEMETDSDQMVLEDGTGSDDPFIQASIVSRLARRDPGDPVIAISSQRRLALLQAERLRNTTAALPILREALRDESADVRLYAVRWIADDRIVELRNEVARLLEGPQTEARYYLAVLAAVDWLDHESRMPGREIADELLAREVGDEHRAPAARALALAMISPHHESLSFARLREFLQSDFEPLRMEAVRTMAFRQGRGSLESLSEVASDDGQPESVRSEAIMGLAPVAREYRELLERLSNSREKTIRKEARRVLRLTGLEPAPTEAKPAASDLAAWARLLNEPGDAAGGRRLFFGMVGARCGVCHRHRGRGGQVGPDLTQIARSASRERILESILQPGREVAPHFQPWVLKTTDGHTLVGLRLAEGGDDGTEEYADASGERFQLASAEIESRELSTTSIMPDGLESTISIDDLRDLMTFLTSSSTN